ncbi:hypothetical protein Sango_0991300 [Sesamum angolense]|uniref:Uncharacterized protein n=1 Tax=Sesamum angolense TaxID=2727404 RepID=A0AAE1WZW9_9LAMI|nr:hypothetical protein Sango_0991300 [Sesamum angolense]
MQELRHLEVMGSDLQDPSSHTACLPNLSTLLGVSAQSCTEEVLERIPNLKELGIQIKLALDAAAAEPSCCFDYLVHLHQLESLKCVIVNPNRKLQVVVPTPPASVFPSCLKRLTLSGLGFPWEYIGTIARLPNLLVLKLQCFGFQGQNWTTSEDEFRQLKFLLLEDTDLKHWHHRRTGLKPWYEAGAFPSLERLIIRHCYRLQEIPLEIGRTEHLRVIEVVDGGPSLVDSARQLPLKDDFIRRNHLIEVRIKSSEDDHKARS